jgi:hypothetical protein
VQHHGAGALDLEIHQRRKLRGDLAGGDAGLGDAEALHVGLGQVDALLRQSTATSCQKLMSCRRCRSCRTGQVGRRVGLVEAQQQPAHRVGRAAAVVGQLGEVGVAGLAHVLAEGVEQVAEQADRQLEGGCCGQAVEDGGELGSSMGRPARWPAAPGGSR